MKSKKLTLYLVLILFFIFIFMATNYSLSSAPIISPEKPGYNKYDIIKLLNAWHNNKHQKADFNDDNQIDERDLFSLYLRWHLNTEKWYKK